MQVSDVYEKVFEAISHPPVKDYVPFSWVSLAQVKQEHYRALANFYIAVGLLDQEGDLDKKTRETLQFLHDIRPDRAGTKTTRPAVPDSKELRMSLGKQLIADCVSCILLFLRSAQYFIIET